MQTNDSMPPLTTTARTRRPRCVRGAVLLGGLLLLAASCNLDGLSSDLYGPTARPEPTPTAPELTTCRPGATRCVDDSGRYEVCDGAGEVVATGQCGTGELCEGGMGGVGACIPLENECEGGEPLRLVPGNLSFKDAQTFKPVRRTVLLTNCGPELMDIQSVELIGRPAFDLDDSDPNAPWLSGRQLGPGEVAAIRVIYHPSPYTDSEQGELRVDVVRRAAPDAAGHRHELRVPLLGRASDALPAPMAEPEPIDFGFVTVGETRVREVLLRNNGPVPINVEWVDIERTGTGQGELSLALPDRFDIAPSEVLAVPARFVAEQPGPMEARYRLWVKPWPADRDRPVVVLRGTAIAASTCEAQPVPVLTAADVREPDNAADDWLEVEPMTTIRLDPTASYAQLQGATVAHHQLTLLEAPGGSVAQLIPLPDAPGGPLRELQVDMAGEYHVGLDVLDSTGQASCSRHVLRILVKPRAALVAELIWVTPGDPSRTDTGAGAGADLDLHLLRTAASGDAPIPHMPWVADPNDCFWLNGEPDWGTLHNGGDDCRLLRDDRDGWGPELVAIAQPEARTYTLDVHSLKDWGYGDSLASVNIFLRGELRYAFVARPLAQGQTWHVATIDPIAGLVTEINTVDGP